MAVRKILQLGDPLLWRPARPIDEGELPALDATMNDLRDTLISFRRRYGSAKAIAAPQIGIPIQLVLVAQPAPTRFLLNPTVQPCTESYVETWENCMSYPGLFVRTSRPSKCVISYRDREWREHVEIAEGELAIVLQHERDHLDGVLSIERAIDRKSFSLHNPDIASHGFLSSTT